MKAWYLQTFPIPWPANVIAVGYITFSIASPVLQCIKSAGSHYLNDGKGKAPQKEEGEIKSTKKVILLKYIANLCYNLSGIELHFSSLMVRPVLNRSYMLYKSRIHKILEHLA